MIHRAILGSIERMFAILTENYSGKWPFWLSPRQAIIIPLDEDVLSYALEVYNELKYISKYYTDINDDLSQTLNKKIRQATLDRYNYIIVIGKDEKEKQSLDVRQTFTANNTRRTITLPVLLEEFRNLTKDYA